MEQLHRRCSPEQVRMILEAYCQGTLDRVAAQDALHLGKTRFFALLRAFRQDSAAFNLEYRRESPSRLDAEVEAEIRSQLEQETALIRNRDLPIHEYNYAAMRDRLLEKGMKVSVSTIIQRAKALGCHQSRPGHPKHEREVVTSAVGALVQHDGSSHLWSPYADRKWTLITSLDDHSRLLLFADLFPGETTWAHIQAAKALMLSYGIPLRYYVDSLRVFRFVQGRDSVWRKHVLQTDEKETQWGQMMRLLGVEVVHALSPQAKGKVERPYRWLQDRIVRTCAYDRISQPEEIRQVLHSEMERYNNHQVHSTTKEIPRIRYEKAVARGATLFRPLKLPTPYTNPDDVFCLRQFRLVNAYRRISLWGREIEVANVPLREEVELHIVPQEQREVVELRFWHQSRLAHTVHEPLALYRERLALL